jgi:hypothetical protein
LCRQGAINALIKIIEGNTAKNKKKKAKQGSSDSEEKATSTKKQGLQRPIIAICNDQSVFFLSASSLVDSILLLFRSQMGSRSSAPPSNRSNFQCRTAHSCSGLLFRSSPVSSLSSDFSFSCHTFVAT